MRVFNLTSDNNYVISGSEEKEVHEILFKDNKKIFLIFMTQMFHLD